MLSAEDAELVKDILSQLGHQEGSPYQGESEPKGELDNQGEQTDFLEPTIEGEPTVFITAEDFENEEEEEAQLILNRKPQPPLTHLFIHSPPMEPYPSPPISPTTAKSPTPSPKSSIHPPQSPIPNPTSQICHTYAQFSNPFTKIPDTYSRVHNPSAPSRRRVFRSPDTILQFLGSDIPTYCL